MSKFKKIVWLGVGALMLLYGTASAQTGSVGSVDVGSNSLTVNPAVPYAEMRLTVSGEGVYWEEYFAPDEFVSADTSQLPDGQYSYEIIASPLVDEADMEKVDGNDPLNPTIDRDEKARTYIQSGSFKVVDGGLQQTADQGTDPSTR